MVYRCLRIPGPARAKKICKKVPKKFGGKEKRCTFAIPFGKWGCERGREWFPDGHEKIIDKTGETVQQVPKNKEFESVNSVSGVAEMSAGHAGMKRMPGSEKLKHYTKKSLILAQDER